MTERDPKRAAERPGREALRLHRFYRGKIQTAAKCPIRGPEDFAIWYTPGVAAPCREIAERPELSYEHTNRANTIAIVSDGTRVLGLGNIGPEAAMPVMEGKALLFKYLGGVDAVPLCLGTQTGAELVRAVRLLEPSFGAINLEDIEQPKCFRVLDELRETASIPVWHDDQQGTATVLLAGFINALEVVGKRPDNVRIAMVGAGAANVANYRLLRRFGVSPDAFVVCDSKGTLHRGRRDVESRQDELREKWRLCCDTNPEGIRGGIAEALVGADVCIAFSRPGPDVIEPSWISRMGTDAIVFSCANPVPEIWPWDALDAGASVVATGRSDFENQLNNSLGFPGIFRGVLDVRARRITDEMALAAADAIAKFARERGLGPQRILPRMDEWEAVPRIAAATAMAAQRGRVARVSLSEHEVLDAARAAIERTRDATLAWMRLGLIPTAPEP